MSLNFTVVFQNTPHQMSANLSEVANGVVCIQTVACTLSTSADALRNKLL